MFDVAVCLLPAHGARGATGTGKVFHLWQTRLGLASLGICGALLAVVVPPVRRDHSRFAERLYQFPIQALLPGATIEALGLSIYQRRPESI